MVGAVTSIERVYLPQERIQRRDARLCQHLRACESEHAIRIFPTSCATRTRNLIPVGVWKHSRRKVSASSVSMPVRGPTGVRLPAIACIEWNVDASLHRGPVQRLRKQAAGSGAHSTHRRHSLTASGVCSCEKCRV